MNKKYLFTAVALTVIILQGVVFSSDVYFKHQEIKSQIVKAIGDSKESIDIAVSHIDSSDILGSLVKAKERGVTIRIVVDRRYALKKGPFSILCKNNEFQIKILRRKETLRGSFAIFDSKLLTTGSYCWGENTGRSYLDQTVFTDEARLLVKYQKEFDLLFHEGMKSGVKLVPYSKKEVSREIVEKRLEEAERVSPNIISGKQIIASNYGFTITEDPDGCIDMNFDEFNNIFGMASGLSDEQKESLWSKCVGRKVKWNGKVNYIGWTLLTGWMMSVTHGDTGVEIKLDSANKSHFSSVKYGNTVTYTGSLDSRVTRIFPYKLTDGDVLDIETTAPRQLSYDELIECPDIVPISQGPKKVFIVETFEDMDNIFGKGSKLSEAEKDGTWKKYEGKYVTWTGQIVYKNINVASGLRVGMTQKESGDVELKINLAKKDKVLQFKDGETVVYSGRLKSRRGSNTPYMLEDGDIVSFK